MNERIKALVEMPDLSISVAHTITKTPLIVLLLDHFPLLSLNNFKTSLSNSVIGLSAFDMNNFFNMTFYLLPIPKSLRDCPSNNAKSE